MEYKDIQEIAIVYGKRDLILEFLENFYVDRQHNGAPLDTILLKKDMKKEVKKFIWKGD